MRFLLSDDRCFERLNQIERFCGVIRRRPLIDESGMQFVDGCDCFRDSVIGRSDVEQFSAQLANRLQGDARIGDLALLSSQARQQAVGFPDIVARRRQFLHPLFDARQRLLSYWKSRLPSDGRPKSAVR